MRPYPFVLNDAVKQPLSKLDNALQSNPLYYYRGDTRFRVVVFDRVLRTYVVRWLASPSELRGLKVVAKRFSKRVTVRLTISRLVYGSVVAVSGSLPFTLSKTSVVVRGPEAALSMLNLRLSKASRRRKRSYRLAWSARTKGTRPSPEDVSGAVPKFRYDGGSYTNQGLTTVAVYHRDYTSTRTPNFVTLASQHRLPVNGHSVQMWRRFDAGRLEQREQLSNAAFSVLTFDSYFSGLGTADYGPNKFGIAHLSSQRNKAIDRLADDIRGETSNLSESIATIRLTFDMINNSVGRINRAVLALRKGNISLASNELFRTKDPRFGRNVRPSYSKDLADNWLALQYGWKPLLADIRYAITSAGKLALADRTVGTSRASATSKSSDAGRLLYGGNSGPLAGGWYKNTTTTTKFVVRYRVASPLRAFLAQSGFTNPVSLAWELLPFSFVVDWFLPIGSFLESFDEWGGLEFLDGCETTFTRDEVGYSRFYYGQNSGGVIDPDRVYTAKGSIYADGILLSRVKMTSLPNRRLPQLKNPFTLTHTLNGLALMRSLFK